MAIVVKRILHVSDVLDGYWIQEKFLHFDIFSRPTSIAANG
jgi:hypothetical protein